MDKCKKCGQNLDKEDKFCRNCGQAVEDFNKAEEEANGETIVPSFTRDKKEETSGQIGSGETNSFVLDTSLIEKARIEKIKQEIEETKNRQEEEPDDLREYKDYELAKTQVIGDINQYLDQEGLPGGEKNQEEDYEDGEEDYDYERDPRYDRPDFSFKKLLIGLGIVVVGVLIIIASIIFLRNRKSLSKEDLVENFIESVRTRDENQVLELLEPGSPDLKVDEGGILAFFNYLDENPSYLDTIELELEDQSKFYDQNKNKDIGDRFENIVLRKKNGDYYLEVKPYYFKLEVPMEGVEIYLEDKKLDISDRDNYTREFGPYMPGIYTLKGKLTSSGDEDAVEQKLILLDEKPDVGKLSKEVSLDLKLVSFKLETNEPDASIVLNGKNTNTKVRELEDGILGPLPQSNTLQLVYKTPFGEIKSREVELNKVKDVLRLNLNYNIKEAIDGIVESINTFVLADAKAKETLDESLYTNVVEPELSKRINILIDMKDLDQSIETDLKEISYDLDSLQIKGHEGSYYAMINTRLELEESFLTDFSVEKTSDIKKFSYLLIYDQTKRTWSIYDIEPASSFNFANTREHRF